MLGGISILRAFLTHTKAAFTGLVVYCEKSCPSDVTNAMNYQKIRERLDGIEGTSLHLAHSTNASEFGAPKEYVEFLKMVGFGRVGNSQFQFYDGVVFVEEVFGYETEETADILLFGDDYQGACTGFMEKDWSVVSVLPDHTVISVADSFETFIDQEF